MEFTERQRQIYEVPGVGNFDPLRLERRLRIASAGRLNEWLDLMAGAAESADADAQAARAEEEVVRAAREAFAFGDNPKFTDAFVLGTLDHFLGWLEGKDSPAASGPTSRPATAGASSPSSPPARPNPLQTHDPATGLPLSAFANAPKTPGVYSPEDLEEVRRRNVAGPTTAGSSP